MKAVLPTNFSYNEEFSIENRLNNSFQQTEYETNLYGDNSALNDDYDLLFFAYQTDAENAINDGCMDGGEGDGFGAF